MGSELKRRLPSAAPSFNTIKGDALPTHTNPTYKEGTTQVVVVPAPSVSVPLADYGDDDDDDDDDTMDSDDAQGEVAPKENKHKGKEKETTPIYDDEEDEEPLRKVDYDDTDSQVESEKSEEEKDYWDLDLLNVSTKVSDKEKFSDSLKVLARAADSIDSSSLDYG